jgi:hypothetical protein
MLCCWARGSRKNATQATLAASGKQPSIAMVGIVHCAKQEAEDSLFINKNLFARDFMFEDE